MIIYTQTPDYYQEYLEHGWLKDQAAKVHKYLERWRGKNGKWYYRYTNAKASAQNALNTIKKEGKYLATKYKNKITKNPKYINAKTKYNRYRMYKDVGESFEDRTDRVLGNRGKKHHSSSITTNFGTKETGHWDNGTANRVYRNAKPTKEGIEAGRKRVADKKKAQKQQTLQKIQRDQQSNRARTEKIKSSGYKQGDLTNRGFSSSSSGGNNAATKNSSVIRKSKNKKSLSNRGYSDSKKITSYRKKGNLLSRGYPSSRIYGNNPVRYDPYTNKFSFYGYKAPEGFDRSKERIIEGNAGADLSRATNNDIDRYGIGGTTKRKKNKQRDARLKDKVK